MSPEKCELDQESGPVPTPSHPTSPGLPTAARTVVWYLDTKGPDSNCLSRPDVAHSPKGPRRTGRNRELRPTYAWHPALAQFSYVPGSPCDSGLALYPSVQAGTSRARGLEQTQLAATLGVSEQRVPGGPENLHFKQALLGAGIAVWGPI